MTDDDHNPTDDENTMPARDDNFAKSERELGRAGFKLIQRFDIRHAKSLAELHTITFEFGRIIRAGRELYLGDDIGFGDWVKRHHLDTGKLGKDQRERNACMQLVILHDDGVAVDEADGEVPRKLDLTGCNNTTPTDIMKWVRRTQRFLFPHLPAPGTNKGKKKPADKGQADLFEPDEKIGTLGVAATNAPEEHSMSTTIGMWIEDFEEATLNMTGDEFDIVIADVEQLLEMLREARKEEDEDDLVEPAPEETPTTTDAPEPTDDLLTRIHAALKHTDWQHTDDVAARIALGNLFVKAQAPILESVGPAPVSGKRKAWQAKIDREWRKYLDLCSKQEGCYLAGLFDKAAGMMKEAQKAKPKGKPAPPPQHEPTAGASKLTWTGNDVTGFVAKGENGPLYDVHRTTARSSKWDVVVYEDGAAQGQRLTKKPFASAGEAKAAAEADCAERGQS